MFTGLLKNPQSQSMVGGPRNKVNNHRNSSIISNNSMSLSLSIADIQRLSILPCKNSLKLRYIESMLDDNSLPETFDADAVEHHELKQCEICETTFNMTSRRHHCRKCGKSVCSKCSANMKALSRQDSKTLFKICDACDTEIENYKVQNIIISSNNECSLNWIMMRSSRPNLSRLSY